MKRITLIFILSTLSVAAMSQTTPRWLRKSSISPDGKSVAFAYQGDIWVVPSQGGLARQITTNPAHEADPIWTKDGKSVVFSSYRELTKDIWSVPAEGGTPTRLTSFQGAETALATTYDGKLVFSSNIQVDPSYSNFPNTAQVYEIPLEGGTPKLLTSIPMNAASVNRDGVILYEDYKGYEDPLRKHHTSSVTRDIWMFNPSDGSYRKLSDFAGEDLYPAFLADGKSFVYASEKSGSINVWRSSTDGSAPVQVSTFSTHPVRYVSAAEDGTILFSFNGDLYTMKEGSQPSRLDITIVKDKLERESIRQSASYGVRDIAPSPSGKEIAVISRGDVYVTSTEAKSTRRITATACQERGICFDADGRSLYYASERDGEWAVYKSSLKNKEDKFFSFSFDFEEERVTRQGQTCFQPSVSPDGKYLAFLRDRSEIVVKEIKSGEEKSLLKGVNYSYSDGDQRFSWSPDSRSILCNYCANGGWNNVDVAVIDVESGKVTNLTQSGYDDAGFRWALGGKAMVWASDKAGYRSHGSWGSFRDVYVMFFDGKAYYEYTRPKNEVDIEKLLKEGDKKEQKKEEKAAKDSTKNAEKGKVEPVKLDLDGREDRIIRLTRASSSIGDLIMSPEGVLYYTTGGELRSIDLRTREEKVVKKGVRGRFFPSKDGKEVYLIGLLSVSRMDLKSGSTKSVSFSGEYDYHPAAEREYIFEHCWKQVSEKFYDTAIHGLDWKAMHDNYAQFLPYIKNNYDFQELLSEMLGELNGSHTGARYRPSSSSAPNTGYIGVLYDGKYSGKGLKIAEMLPGGMLGNVDPEIKAGDVILAVDGVEIPAGKAWYEVFAWTSGKRVQLVIEKSGKKTALYLTPGSSDAALLYTRWVRQREQMVERLSGGKVGYVHVKGMDSPSFREVYSKALGKYRGCDALIVDTRHNGGGWLHGDLADFLNGEAYIEYRPRGQYVGTDPFYRWTKPSCVLMCEDNYSDACGFPYVYRSLGIGKLIGAPVPGTMTAVWWETQVDASLVFGIPQVTSWGLKEDRPLENLQIEPDILVYNDPESVLRGEDKQLEAAVAEMLREIQK